MSNRTIKDKDSRSIMSKSSILNINRDELWRVVMHIPVGMATWLVSMFAWYLRSYLGWGSGWIAGIIWVVLFLTYEVIQDWRIFDHSWKDIKGFVWGFFLGGILFTIMLFIMSMNTCEVCQL